MLPSRDSYIESCFPDLHRLGYKITSPINPDYNCIAWAGGDDLNWWEPDPLYIYSWPVNAPREYTSSAYIAAYETIGYEVCENSENEEGYEKIAIFLTPDGVPRHAARKLDNELWTSKLGKSYDISHHMHGTNGVTYGEPKIFMKRKNT